VDEEINVETLLGKGEFAEECGLAIDGLALRCIAHMVVVSLLLEGRLHLASNA
jgi:hypothetical protein